MLEHISKKKLSPNNKIKAFFCIKNQKSRLPYLLDYYRKLGINEFFAVDNNSSDDTQAYLLSQPDVHVFYTQQSFREAEAGRLWTTELCRQYGIGSWCLTIDVDEFLILPYIEKFGLQKICDYMDQCHYQGIYCLLLDFYHNQPASKTLYQEGDCVFEKAAFHDNADAYYTILNSHARYPFPPFKIKGGVRQRIFLDANDKRIGPPLVKIPLVKWTSDFAYFSSTHCSTEIALSDFTGVLAHFKFFDDFREYAKKAVQENDRYSNIYEIYHKKMTENEPDLFDSNISISYKNSTSLLENRLMSCSSHYFSTCYDDINDMDSKKEYEKEMQFLDSLNNSFFSYRYLMQLWPYISGHSNQTLQYKPTISMTDPLLQEIAHSKSWRLITKIKSLIRFSEKKNTNPLKIKDPDQPITYQDVFNIYHSVWWDLLAPLRIIMRGMNKCFGFRFKKYKNKGII